MTLSAGALATLVLLICLSCSAVQQPRAPGEPAPQVVAAVASNRQSLAECGGVTFPLAVLNAQPDANEQTGPEFDALAETVDEIRQYVPVPVGATWRLAARTGDRITFVTNVEGDWYYAVIILDENGWHPTTMGDCLVRRVVSEQLGVATWWLDPRYPPPAADSTVLEVMVQEQACASGSYATGRIGTPEAEYAIDAVILTIGVHEVGGTCPGNPSTPAIVVLPEPIGERALLDGSYIPAAPPRPPD